MISAYLDWWAAAGVEDSASDAPTNWLAAPVGQGTAARAKGESPDATPAHDASRQRTGQPASDTRLTAASKPPAADPAIPAFADLAALDAWLSHGEAVPMRHWSQRLALPSGPYGAELMILADWPDEDDIAAGRLFAGASGALLDAMTQAINLPPDAVRRASIALTRPTAPRFDAAAQTALLPIARSHVRLAAPKALLVVGGEAARLFCGNGAIPAPELQPVINQDGGMTAVFVTHHPRTLLLHAALKRHAWEVLKRVREHLDNGANSAGF